MEGQGHGRYLQGSDGCRLKAQVRLEVLSDLANQPLKRQTTDEQLGALLVATNLAQSHRARTVSVRLLNAAGAGRALASRLGGELFAWRLSAGRFASRLLCSSHFLFSSLLFLSI